MTAKNEKTSFEEALTATGFGKFNYAILVLCGGLVSAMVFEALSISFLVAASACELQTTIVQQGLAAGMPIFGVIATSHVWGYLADTRGRRPVILVSLLLGFSTGLLSAFSPNWIVLCVLKLFSCSAVSGTFALSMTMLSECTPVARRNTMIIVAASLFMSSNGLMAIVAIPILPLDFSYPIDLLNIQFNSWRLLSIIFTMPCAIAAVGMYFSCESPKYLLSVGEEEKALEVLKTIFTINTGKSGKEYQVDSIILDEELTASKTVGLWSSIKSQTIPLLKPPLLKSTIILSFLFVGIYMCVNPYIIWLPTVADGFMRSVERGDSGLTFCQMLESGQNATTTQPDGCILNSTGMVIIFAISVFYGALNTAMSVLTNKLGRRRILISIEILTGVVGMVINFSNNAVLNAVLFIVYLSPMLGIGLITTFTVDVYPTHLRAMAVCLTLMVGRGSAIVGINILKSMLVYNCEASFYVFSSITLVCGAVAFLLPADGKKNKKSVEN